MPLEEHGRVRTTVAILRPTSHQNQANLIWGDSPELIRQIGWSWRCNVIRIIHNGNMKKSAPPKAEIEEKEFPGLSGGTMRIRKTQSGIVNFSNTRFDIADSDKKNIVIENSIALDWQTYNELQDDHGLSMVCSILHPLGLYILSNQKRNMLLTEIKSKISDSGWGKFELFLNKLEAEQSDRNSSDLFIVASWAQLFAEPFEEVWLAAMAHHAYYQQDDDFAFGYLTALLDQKELSERHFLRGREILKSASLGGMAKSIVSKRETRRTLAELERLMLAGHTVARASDLAFKNGFGTSAPANRKLWNRHLKK